jgi:predicted RecA/RadA family phage recombinase
MKQICVLLLMMGAIGCGYSSKGSGTMGSAPTVTQLTPSTTAAGGLAFSLTVNGSNFADGAVVYWSGGTRTTKFVSATQVTAAISAADIATAATVGVYVRNPGIYMNQPGQSSNTMQFTISP